MGCGGITWPRLTHRLTEVPGAIDMDWHFHLEDKKHTRLLGYFRDLGVGKRVEFVQWHLAA